MTDATSWAYEQEDKRERAKKIISVCDYFGQYNLANECCRRCDAQEVCITAKFKNEMEVAKLHRILI